MRSFYDSIYLSPHLDDAALSCSGQIHSQTASGKTVLIVTVMAGDPPTAKFSEFAHSLHERWELITDTVAKRREEDISACQMLTADYLHWDIPDCIYRMNPSSGQPLYSQWADVIGKIDPAEADLIAELAGRIENLPGYGRIFAPLKVGNHVDHQITRAAAEMSLVENLCYYEDYPYVRDAGTLEKVISANDKSWHSEVIPLNERDLRAKVESIAAFISQLGSFFDDKSDLERAVNDYAKLVGGERIWHRLATRSNLKTS